MRKLAPNANVVHTILVGMLLLVLVTVAATARAAGVVPELQPSPVVVTKLPAVTYSSILAREAALQAEARLREPTVFARVEQEVEREGIQAGQVQGNASAPTGALPQSLGTNFRGITLADEYSAGGGSIPPDTMGAVGPNHFMEMLNGRLAIYSKSTGSLIGGTAVSLNSFFGNPSGGATDPRVVYDRRSGRWIICIINIGNGTTANSIFFGVSATNDPTGTWAMYNFQAGTATSFCDYETLGVDDNGVYFGGTQFATNNTQHAVVFALAKAPLLAGTPVGASFDNITDMFSSPQPAVNLDATAGGRAWIVSSSTTVFGNVNYRTITWNGTTPGITATSVAATPGYNDIPLITPSGSSLALETGDDRLMMAVIRGGQLWTCRHLGVNSSGNSGSADRTACEWLKLDVSTATATLQDSGRVFDPAATNPRFYFYPSIMVTGQGHAVMGFSGASSTEFVGCYVSGRRSTDPAGQMSLPSLLHGGQAAYTITYSGSRNRFGDYSYTSLDPSDDMSIWTVQEYAEALGTSVGGSTSRWGTWVGRYLAPALSLNNPAASATKGQNGVSVPFTGAGFFDPGSGFTRPTASISGDGISALQVSFASATSGTLTFNVAANATSGSRSFTLTNPDGQSVTVSNALTISGSATIGFPSATGAAAEGFSGAINVSRSGDTSGTSTVNFAVSNGTALLGTDFQMASTGTLTFSPGDSAKTIPTTFSTDHLIEGNETFQVTLSNPSGASLGTNAVLTVTIQDDVTTTAPSAVVLSAVKDTQLTVGWNDNSDNETGFQIERSTDGGANFSLAGTVGANLHTFTNTCLQAGASYTYRVRAINGALTSGYSASATGATTLGAGTLSILPATLAFPLVKVGQSKSLSFTIKNTGKVSATGNIVNPVATDYTVTAGLGEFCLAKGKSLKVTVRFAPSTTGTRPGTLAFTSSYRGHPTTNVKLTGKGKP